MVKFTGVVKVLKIRIDADRTIRDRWMVLARETQRCYNAMFRTWFVWHVQQGNHIKVREFIDQLTEWNKADPKTRGPKPTCDVVAFPKELAKIIYDEVRGNKGQLAGRSVDLLMSKEMSDFIARNATNSAFKRWMVILADRGEFQSASKPMPIRFDAQNSKLSKDGDDYKLTVRVEGGGTRNVVDTVKLDLKRAAKYASIVQKIISGEYKFSGSNLVFDSREKRWYVAICYQLPVKVTSDLNPDKTAVLVAADDRPWRLEVDGRSVNVGMRDGRQIEYVKRTTLLYRQGLNEGYRYATSSRRGRGRKRAMAAHHKLRPRWNDFVKTANQRLAAEVMQILKDRDCGTLIYVQPTEKTKSQTYIGSVMKDSKAQMCWDFAQLGSILSRKGQELGVSVEIQNDQNAVNETLALS